MESIKILEHTCLPDHSNSKVVSPRTNTDALFVKDLFLEDRRVWDPGLVERIFLPWEAELIQQIPVSEEYVEDLLIWSLTRTGDYSVQSPYQMLETNARRLNPGSFSLDGQSKAVWKSNISFVRFYRKQYWSFFERRNRLRENQPTWPLKEVGERAIVLVREFFDACKSDAGPSVLAAHVRWSRPPEGIYKVNFDAAMFENSSCAGIGMAIRDSDSEIIATLSQRIPLPFSVEMEEAMAALFAQGSCLSKE
uniref:RNase H type-1 domain-containing protein n=1 Tax=Quercus lobata TaxID=97700 RepID=A0A7N2KNZ5_QUELO